MTDYVVMFKSGETWMYLSKSLKLTGSKFKAKTWKKSETANDYVYKKNLDRAFAGYEWMVSEK